MSFILSRLAGASSLQCFAAGAALCSTSLGTTFAVLRASGLSSTRLGVVLTSAAMLDDVIGLVMVQVISNLGGSEASVDAVTIVRPVLVSVAFAAVAIVVCRFAIKPATVILNNWRATHGDTRLNKLLAQKATALVLHTGLLIALVIVSSYAGTSNLFAAYIAGAAIGWWDSEVPHPRKPPDQGRHLATEQKPTDSDEHVRPPGENGPTTVSRSRSKSALASEACLSCSGSAIFEHYYHPVVHRVLQPFFFASIGFSIPITRMFTGSIIWKGVVYSILMATAKLMCGLWLVQFPGVVVWLRSMMKSCVLDESNPSQPSPAPTEGRGQTTPQADQGEHSSSSVTPTSPISPGSRTSNRGDNITLPTSTQGRVSEARSPNTIPGPPKPISLYPASILGLAMVPRGEIGFLISSVAWSNGVFSGSQASGESEVFLIVTWAIFLCTIFGPLCVGLMVRRVRKLESQAISSTRQDIDASWRNALGVWGVQ